MRWCALIGVRSVAQHSFPLAHVASGRFGTRRSWPLLLLTQLGLIAIVVLTWALPLGAPAASATSICARSVWR